MARRPWRKRAGSPYENVEQANGGLGKHFFGADERGLAVERVSGVGRKGGGDAEGGVLRLALADALAQEGRRVHVPRRVAAGLERRANATAGERRRVGLSLHLHSPPCTPH